MFLSQERILSYFIIIVIFSLDHVNNHASVNSSCAQTPTSHGLTPGHYLGWQIPGGGELFSAGIDRCVINTEALVLNFEKIQVLA